MDTGVEYPLSHPCYEPQGVRRSGAIFCWSRLGQMLSMESFLSDVSSPSSGRLDT